MFDKRKSGVLVHPTSFPGAYGMGDLGAGAYAFIDFLQKAKQTLWQILPLGPTGYGDSPYQSFSSFAGNHYLISFDALKEQGLLSAEDLAQTPHFDLRKIDFGSVINYKMQMLRKAFVNFKPTTKFKQFCTKNKDWLEDYALFTALKDHNGGREWFKWDKPLAKRDPAALKDTKAKFAKEMEFCKFLQYEFFRQWRLLKDYANKAGVQIIGDIPIFVAHDSADTWAHPELYYLDEAGLPTCVAGCPPDYFAETGQLWGNPLYNWEVHKNTGYAWWCKRLAAVLETVDYVRIDHFRGFESYWEIPYGDKTAENGKWVKGPGKALFTAINNALGFKSQSPIIAEDLGEITDKVIKLRTGLKLPGMRVLHFAFTPGANSNHLPHNYESSLLVVYSGTHDNNTTIGWYADASEKERDYLRRYLNISGEDVAWDLIRAAFASSAVFAVVPIQDVMSLTAADRMNRPGEAMGCWSFRYTAGMLTSQQAERLAYLSELFFRG